jgi:hypothetical protein
VLPGGRLPLTLAWFGAAAVFCAALLAVLYGAEIGLRNLALIALWGAVAMALGVKLRSSSATTLRLLGFLWILPAVGAFIWLTWVRYV